MVVTSRMKNFAIRVAKTCMVQLPLLSDNTLTMLMNKCLGELDRRTKEQTGQKAPKKEPDQVDQTTDGGPE